MFQRLSTRGFASIFVVTSIVVFAPASLAQHLLVGGPDTFIRRTLPVAGDFDVVGASASIVESMAAAGDTTYIGDVSGTVYEHTLQFGVQYAFPSATDAKALATVGDLLFVGGSNGLIERHLAPTRVLETTWRAPGSIRALAVVGSTLYAGLDGGLLASTDIDGLGIFTILDDCGRSISAMTSDASGLIVGTTGGDVFRLDSSTQTLAPIFSTVSDCAAMGVHLNHLLIAGSDGLIRRVDAWDGTPHAILDVGSSVSALALTEGVPPAWTYCYGEMCPCGNDDPIGGCANSTGRGARLDAAGSTSVSRDDLALFMTRAPARAPAILLMGSASTWSTVGDGILCTGGSGTTRRFAGTTATRLGALVMDDLGSFAANQFGPAAQLSVGTSWHFQVWYRDASSPCGAGFNTTNSAQVLFTP